MNKLTYTFIFLALLSYNIFSSDQNVSMQANYYHELLGSNQKRLLIEQYNYCKNSLDKKGDIQELVTFFDDRNHRRPLDLAKAVSESPGDNAFGKQFLSDPENQVYFALNFDRYNNRLKVMNDRISSIKIHSKNVEVILFDHLKYNKESTGKKVKLTYTSANQRNLSQIGLDNRISSIIVVHTLPVRTAKTLEERVRAVIEHCRTLPYQKHMRFAANQSNADVSDCMNGVYDRVYCNSVKRTAGTLIDITKLIGKYDLATEGANVVAKNSNEAASIEREQETIANIAETTNDEERTFGAAGSSVSTEEVVVETTQAEVEENFQGELTEEDREEIANRPDHTPAPDSFYHSIVHRLYNEILGRDADRGGLAGYTNYLRSGKTEEDLRNILLNSEEYKRKAELAQRIADSKYGTLDPEEILVHDLYNKVFKRNADPSGLNGYSAALKDGRFDEAKLLEVLLNSGEFKRTYKDDHPDLIIAITEKYQGYLGRDPADEELSGYVKMYLEGKNDSYVNQTFLDSDEYKNQSDEERKLANDYYDADRELREAVEREDSRIAKVREEIISLTKEKQALKDEASQKRIQYVADEIKLRRAERRLVTTIDEVAYENDNKVLAELHSVEKNLIEKAEAIEKASQAQSERITAVANEIMRRREVRRAGGEINEDARASAEAEIARLQAIVDKGKELDPNLDFGKANEAVTEAKQERVNATAEAIRRRRQERRTIAKNKQEIAALKEKSENSLAERDEAMAKLARHSKLFESKTDAEELLAIKNTSKIEQLREVANNYKKEFESQTGRPIPTSGLAQTNFSAPASNPPVDPPSYQPTTSVVEIGPGGSGESFSPAPIRSFLPTTSSRVELSNGGPRQPPSPSTQVYGPQPSPGYNSGVTPAPIRSFLPTTSSRVELSNGGPRQPPSPSTQVYGPQPSPGYNGGVIPAPIRSFLPTTSSRVELSNGGPRQPPSPNTQVYGPQPSPGYNSGVTPRPIRSFLPTTSSRVELSNGGPRQPPSPNTQVYGPQLPQRYDNGGMVLTERPRTIPQVDGPEASDVPFIGPIQYPSSNSSSNMGGGSYETFKDDVYVDSNSAPAPIASWLSNTQNIPQQVNDTSEQNRSPSSTTINPYGNNGRTTRPNSRVVSPSGNNGRTTRPNSRVVSPGGDARSGNEASRVDRNRR